MACEVKSRLSRWQLSAWHNKHDERTIATISKRWEQDSIQLQAQYYSVLHKRVGHQSLKHSDLHFLNAANSMSPQINPAKHDVKFSATSDVLLLLYRYGRVIICDSFIESRTCKTIRTIIYSRMSQYVIMFKTYKIKNEPRADKRSCVLIYVVLTSTGSQTCFWSVVLVRALGISDTTWPDRSYGMNISSERL